MQFHLSLCLNLSVVLTFKLFAPSPYDFRVDPEERVYEGYLGFLKKHFYVPDKNHFGELSLMSLNSHIDRDTLEKKQQESLMSLIDFHHPSIFSIQGLSQTEYESLSPVVSDHYESACKDALFTEVWTNKIEVLPIFYDRYAIIKIREYVFQPKEYEKQAYGCLGVFYSKLTEQIFSVVNIDLPSTDEDLVNVQIYNILEHLEDSNIKDFPIFITGTINKLGDKLKKLIDTNFINLNTEDKNNVGLNKTTFHRHGHVNDNIQRDFILLKDQGAKFKLNYSRTLSRYPKDNFEHFANFAILSRNPAGQCVFSGYAVPRGSGINTVGNDGKMLLTRSGKERALINLKISPRDCSWTQSSRAFHKKTNKSVKEQSNFIPITKIVRGFTLIPKALVAEAPKVEKSKKDESIRKNEKVNLKSNIRK